jgi:pyruvate kinase
MARTKIVCTIGPASRSPQILRGLILAGMNVARLNFSHGTHAEHLAALREIRRLSRALNRPVAVLQDLSGPKIRVGEVAGGVVTLRPGARFTLTSRRVAGDDKEVSVSYPRLPAEVRPGDPLLLSDGALELVVVRRTVHDIVCRVITGGPLGSHKGINLPSRSLKVPSLTAKDRKDLAFGIRHGVDYVALSFVRSPGDILEARRFIESRGASIPIVAKIEKHEALERIDEIVSVADAVMVARGDLGVETPLENVPQIQKMLIRKSNQSGKPVITATQMLRSMVDSPRPTRAEVTDVANAVFDGTDAVMLSEETAVGGYPVEAVRTMVKVAEDAEAAFPYEAWTRKWSAEKPVRTMADAVALSACTLAESIRAACLITFTSSGSTARLVSRYRPACCIAAPTPRSRTYRRLALVWGVVPILSRRLGTADGMIRQARRSVLAARIARKGQNVVITAGVPLGVEGTTNLIKAEKLA